MRLNFGPFPFQAIKCWLPHPSPLGLHLSLCRIRITSQVFFWIIYIYCVLEQFFSTSKFMKKKKLFLFAKNAKFSEISWSINWQYLFTYRRLNNTIMQMWKISVWLLFYFSMFFYFFFFTKHTLCDCEPWKRCMYFYVYKRLGSKSRSQNQ